METAISIYQSKRKEHPVRVYHTTADTSIHLLAAQLSASADAVRAAIFAVVDSARTRILHNWTRRHLARLSDHMLRDFGFEREWDGTIHSLRNTD